MIRKEIHFYSDNSFFSFFVWNDRLLNDNDLLRYFLFDIIYVNITNKLDNIMKNINSKCIRNNFRDSGALFY